MYVCMYVCIYVMNMKYAYSDVHIYVILLTFYMNMYTYIRLPQVVLTSTASLWVYMYVHMYVGLPVRKYYVHMQ